MTTVASKVLAQIAALTKDHKQTPIGQAFQKLPLLTQNLSRSYSSNEEILVDQELTLNPKLNLAPFNTIQANSLPISEIHQRYTSGLENNRTRALN